MSLPVLGAGTDRLHVAGILNRKGNGAGRRGEGNQAPSVPGLGSETPVSTGEAWRLCPLGAVGTEQRSMKLTQQGSFFFFFSHVKFPYCIYFFLIFIKKNFFLTLFDCFQSLLHCARSFVMAHGLSCSKACGVLVPRQGAEPTSPCNALDHQESPSVRMTFCDLWADAGLRMDRLGAPGASALLESPLCLGHIDCPCREGSLGSHIPSRITMMWATSSGVCLPMACPAHDSEAFCADETRMGKAWYVRGDRQMGRWGWVFVAQSCPTPWTTARQALLSVEFSWQEYWSGLPWRGTICCKYV